MSERKLIYGVGINDSTSWIFSYNPDGKYVPNKDYEIWRGMFARCYSSKKQVRDPSYIGCSVDPRWHKFTEFQKWFGTQDHEGKQLDKDILVVGNKVYSPETCCFVTNDINSLLRIVMKKDGIPQGIRLKGDKYQARIGVHGKRVYLGSFKTVEEAQEVWVVAKVKHIREKAQEVEDLRIREGLLRHAMFWEEKIG